MQFYKKLLFTFATIAIVYTIVIGSILIYFNQSSTDANFQNSFEMLSSQAASYTSARIEYILELEQLLKANSFTSKYILENPTDPDRYSRVQLSNFIIRLHGLSSVEKNKIAITKISDNYAILNDSTGTVNFMLKEFNLTSDDLRLIEEHFDNFASDSFCFLTTESENSETEYTFVKQVIVNNPTPIYLFVQYTHNQLFDELSEAQMLTILYSDAILASSNKVTDTNIENLLENDNEYIKKFISSSVPNISFVYAAKLPDFIDTATFLIIAGNIAVLIISLLIMFFITQKMYSPIKQTLTSTGFKNNFNDEFFTIRSAFSQMQANINNMSDTLGQYKDFMRNKFNHDLLYGLLSHEEVTQTLSQLNAKTFDNYIVCLIKFNQNADPNVDTSQAIIYNARKEFEEILSGNKDTYCIVNIDITTLAIIYISDNSESLSEYLKGVILSVEPMHGLEITAYISLHCKDIFEVNKCFNRVNYLCEMSEFNIEKPKTIIYEEITHFNNKFPNSVYYPLSVEQNIISAVVHDKESVWQATIEEIIATNKHNNNIQKLSIMISATISRVLDALPQEYSRTNLNLPNVENSRTYEQLLNDTSLCLNSIAQIYRQKHIETSDALKIKMQQFIAENYNKEISLFDLADALNVSKNYASTLFKKLTDQNFKDYLAEYRFNIACEIIKNNPRIKIKTVSSQVGCNPDILHRLFLKYAKCSPSEYQKDLQK